MNILNQNITTQEHKTYKLLYQYQIIKTILNNSNAYLFFVDFLTEKNLQKLKEFLKENNLILIKLKKTTIKTIFSDKNFIYLKNIMHSNIFLIYHKDITKSNTILNNKIFSKLLLLNTNNIHLLGIWYNKKFYRISEFKKFLILNKNIQITLIKIFNWKLNLLQKYLSLKI